MRQWIDYPHVLDTRQFKERRVIEELFETANEFKRKQRKRVFNPRLAGNLLACVFYEASTRTRFSFEAAAKRLGCATEMTESAKIFSSAAKGESLRDTAITLAQYADGICIRHPDPGAADVAAGAIASFLPGYPVINAGDGDNQHPTQALLDLFTINDEKSRIDNLKVGMVGDLRKGRTVRSLAYLLAQQTGNEICFIAPESLGPRDDIKEYLKEKGVPYTETDELRDAMRDLDVLYVTRLQLERLNPKDGEEGVEASAADIERIKSEYNNFIVNEEVASLLPSDAIIMHPLPRVDEIPPEVDQNPRAVYFAQVKNGMFVRMALLNATLKPYSQVA